MIWKKIALLSLVLLVAFIVFRWETIFSQNTKPLVSEVKTKMPDVSPEVREKAFGLLNEVLAESESLKSNSSKLQMQIEIADLLWEKDETKARKIFQSFVSETSKESCLCELLMEENIKKIAKRDAKIAIQIDYFSGAGDEMDVIFETFLKQYPQEALEKSKDSLGNNFAMNFFRNDPYESYDRQVGILKRLELIYAQDSKKGADFAKAILAKLKENKMNVRHFNYKSNSAANTAKPSANIPYYSNSNTYSREKYGMNAPANSYANKPANISFSNSNISNNYSVNNVDFSKVRDFFEIVIASKESVSKGQTQMLIESELGELAKLMVNAVIATKKIDSYEVQGIYNELKKYAPQETTKLEKKLLPNQLRDIKKPLDSMEWDKSDDDMSHYIKLLPIPANETSLEKREREFIDHIRYILKIVNHCNVEEDAITFAQIQNKNKYPDMVEYFEDYMPTAMAKIGNIKELRKYLKKETDNSKKIELLSFAAEAISAQKDKDDLAELLKESNITIPNQYKNVTEFKVMMNYAKILSITSPTKSFDFLEQILNNANEIINSAAIIAQFSEHESQETGEFRFATMQKQIAKNSPFTISLIKKLAHFDFERTKKLADKFTRSEVRLFIKWHIANSLLNKNAPDDEAKFYEVEPCG